MRTKMFIACCLAASVAVLGLTDATAQSSMTGKIGLRAGVGTDISGGLVYGVGGNYLIAAGANAVELGVQVFGGSFEESTDEGINTYNEKTDVLVFSVMANYLINYDAAESRTFFLAGFGLGSINVEWEESSPTDGSLGTPLPGGGSMQTDDGSVGGSIFNLGVGRTFKGAWDVRAELPVIVTFSEIGEASQVVPTLTLTGGYRF